MKIVYLDELIQKLIELDYLRYSKVQPTHGPCCTCQSCGHDKDFCVCEDNELLEELEKLSVEIMTKG